MPLLALVYGHCCCDNCPDSSHCCCRSLANVVVDDAARKEDSHTVDSDVRPLLNDSCRDRRRTRGGIPWFRLVIGMCAVAVLPDYSMLSYAIDGL